MASSWAKALKLLDDQDPAVRIKGVRELGRLRAKDCVSDLLRLLHKDENDDVKVESIAALGKIADISTGDEILELLRTEDIPLLLESINTLGILCTNGFSKAIAPLEDLLSHSNYRVRKFTIDALGMAGSSSSIPKLFELFKENENNIELQEMIVSAIGYIGGPQAIEIIKSLLLPNDLIPDSKMEVRRAAIKALGDSRTPVALEVLGTLLNDKEEHKIIRKYAEDAIKKTIEGAKEQYLSIKNRAESILKGK